MKRLILTLTASCLAALTLASPASAAFGFKSADLTFTEADGSAAVQAGSHPFALTNSFDVNTVIEGGKTLPDCAFLSQGLRSALPLVKVPANAI